MDKISIITTVYNASEYLVYSLLSVLNQRINENIKVEYIIVNDCSTDGSLYCIKECIDKYKNKKIKPILYDLKENIGCGAARKYGIDKATGDYFMFLDADDYYIHDDFISRAYQNIKENKADIIEYGVLYNDSNGKKTNMVSPTKKIIEDGINAVYLLFKNNTIKFNVWSKIYSKNIIDSFPYDISREYEDIRTIPIWLKNANKIIIENTIEINYRASDKSIIRNNGLKTRIGTITAMTEIMKVFKDYPQILKEIYNRSMIDLCAVMEGKTSKNEGFNEMSKLNTKQLSYIYPDTYKDITYNIE